MNSSVKFFAPRVTGGLPWPGCPLGAAGVELELELFLLEPQAVKPTASATASSATIDRYHVLLVIRFPPLLSCTCERGALLRPGPSPPQRSRRGEVLEQREHTVGQERQGRHEDRRRNHALELVTRLVRDDVAQPFAAGERGERGGGHHVERRGGQAGEDERQRERDLDPSQDLPRRHPHAARGLDQI